MNNTIADIVARIRAFNEPENDDALLQLDADVAALVSQEQSELTIQLLFNVFERHPEADDPVFWGIMHALESISGYEPFLLESVRRKPSAFGVFMLNRLLNAEQHGINGADLLQLLTEASTHPLASPSVKEDALGFIEYQQQQDSGDS
jgi:hypothetical protein